MRLQYSEDVFEVRVDDESAFDPFTIQLQRKAGSFSAFFNRYANTVDGGIKGRVASHEERLQDVANEKWRGCIGTLSAAVPKEVDWSPFGAPPSSEEKGALATIVSTKPDLLRLGPAAMNFPCLPQLIVGVTPMCWILFDSVAAMKTGIVMRDMESFLGGPMGEKMMSESKVG